MHLFNLIFALLSLLAITFAAPAVSKASASVSSIDEVFNSTLSVRSFPGGFDNVNAQPHFGWPYCRNNRAERGEECIFTTRQTSPNSEFFEIYLFDHNCVLIGVNDHVHYWMKNWNFYSQLPYSIVIDSTGGGKIGFWYAGRLITPREYRGYECYNTGDGNKWSILPACQIRWDCSS